jgi:hypothetical protein
MSYVIVLSQPECVEREVRSFIAAEAAPARLGRWLSWMRP